MTVLLKSNYNNTLLDSVKEQPVNQLRYKPKRQNFITSYGIILFTILNKTIYYQLCQPRDSVNYVSFMRGIYSKKQLRFFLSLMTKNEIYRIKTSTFNVLWDDLWFGSNCILFTMDYKKAKKRFHDNYEYVLEIIKELNDDYCDNHLWGFPKGKRHSNEKHTTTALREFVEETRIESSKINIVSDIPLVESYHGSNNKLYKTVYYPAISSTKLYNEEQFENSPLRVEKPFIVSNEIDKLQWFTYEDAMKNFSSRPYRQRMLTVLHTCITEQIK
jgi:8-oxo-dGTP pyrophosphatase MutT (NUDIX family)